MAALQVKQICMYLELADLSKIINTKLVEGEDRLTQTLVFPKPKPKPFEETLWREVPSQHFLYAKGKEYNSN